MLHNITKDFTKSHILQFQLFTPLQSINQTQVNWFVVNDVGWQPTKKIITWYFAILPISIFDNENTIITNNNKKVEKKTILLQCLTM